MAFTRKSPVFWLSQIALVLGSLSVGHFGPAYFSTPPIPPAVQTTKAEAVPPCCKPWAVFYSPTGGCTDALCAEIKRAKKSIHVLSYSFTSEPIADALIEASQNGVEVEVVVDKSQPSAHGSMGERIVKEGILTWVDHKHAIAHNKIVIIDNRVVCGGSFNHTKAAEVSNAENLIIIRDSDLAKLYEANFQLHKAHSEAWPTKK